MSETESPPTVAPRSSLGRMKVLAFAALVVIVECALAFFLLPSQADTAAMAASLHAAPGETHTEKPAEQAHEEGKEKELEPLVEVDLGQFSVAAYQPLTNSTQRIDFHLWGAVPEEEEAEAREILLHNAQRLREDVIVTVRGADVADLSDAGLGLIKRRILAKSNRLFGRPMLKSVIFSDFSFIEQ
jgi:hypothetical protein